ILLTLARSFSNKPQQLAEPAKGKGRNGDNIEGGRPGDDYNKKTDFRELLVSNGWLPTGKSGLGGEHWTRPGKDGDGTSGTLKFNHLYVFSSNAVMPAGKAYDAFSFYAWANHGGDYKAAARELGKKGYGGNAIGVHDIEWSDPIPLPDSSSVTCEHEYPIEMLPEAVRKAAVEVSRFSKVPSASPGTIGLSCCGVSIGNKAVVVERQGLKHYSSVFLALIAQSGARKSDPFKIMTAPLTRWSENGLEKYNRDKQKVIWHNSLLETAIAAQNAKAKKEGANLGAITKKILKLESKKRALPSDPYLFTSDTTEERLFQLMEEHRGAYAVMSGEGRPVIDGIMGRYSGAGRTGDATYLAGISGDTITRDRVSGVNGPESGRIIKPCLNVCIMLQPDKYLEAACCKTLRQSGALARILPIFLPSMVGCRIEEVDEPGLNASRMATYNNMIETLLNTPHKDTPHEACLSPKAAEARRKYHNSLEMMMGNDGDLADVRDIASKATTQVAKLALILHLADNPKLLNRKASIIRLPTWRRAERLGRYHLKEAIRVQRQAIETEGIDIEYARRILGWVKTNNFVTIAVRKIQQGMPRPRGAAHEIKGALKVLIEHGYMKVRDNLYFVNPNSCAKL
ncbi:MAG: DUF3987 domain-containing protein, partial [Desulfurivibrionaceae bacterium]|nr:DUF3987 domain-containing protein [Desulfurivibrionaceae bacterium]